MPTPFSLEYRRNRYREYIDSEAWAHLRRTMPGPRECLACASKTELHLHHMFYPEDVYLTRHFHCCWLCATCHDLFHKTVKRSALGLPAEVWEMLRKQTKRIIGKQLRKSGLPTADTPKPAPRALTTPTVRIVVVKPR